MSWRRAAPFVSGSPSPDHSPPNDHDSVNAVDSIPGSLARPARAPSPEVVVHEEVKNHRAKDEVAECPARNESPSARRSAPLPARDAPFRGHGREDALVVRVDLGAHARGEDKLADGGREAASWSVRELRASDDGQTVGRAPAEERVERVVCDQDAVKELGDAGEHEEQLQGVEQLELLGGCDGRQRVSACRRAATGRVGSASPTCD